MKGGRNAAAVLTPRAARPPLSPHLIRRGENLLVSAERELKKLLTNEAAATLEYRHRAGIVVQQVRDSAEYGDSGARKLGKALGVSLAYLYKLGNFASAFTAEQLAAAQKAAESCKYILTFSILEPLCRIDSRAERDEVLRKAIAERWTSRQLRRSLVVAREAPPSFRGVEAFPALASETATLSRRLVRLRAHVDRIDWSDSGAPAARLDAAEALLPLGLAVLDLVMDLCADRLRVRDTSSIIQRVP